ncbi:LAME_0G00496g1_1 [Lachancea meyersii CBS 8951]|uniref:Protein PBN1 n=1 Tax=Lachancea meyersii CBS 8951 TaxID=1266667 RepID=A0A1G4K4S4_9SACH|nr:LAME_0G00496g1_1 [Lachancea meyersii CBS 8951]
MVMKRTRITVLFDSLQDLEKITPDSQHGQEGNNSESIEIIGTGQQIQHRTTLDHSSKFQHVRITWKSSKSFDSILKAPLMEGLNIYVVTGEPYMHINGAIKSAKYQLLHSDFLDKELLRRFLPPEVLDVSSVDWTSKDYDISLDREKQKAQVDKYYKLETDQTQNITFTDTFGKLEVGLFFPEFHDTVDVHLNGARCTWNRDGAIEHCQKTYLFYQRAHAAALEGRGVPVDLLEPVGLHPTLSVDLRDQLPSDNCAYYMYLMTPADIFIDKFQSSPIFLAGASDLEAPEYSVRGNSWGMETLLALTPGDLNEVKLHSRYIQPQASGGYKSIKAVPKVFQACDSDHDNIHENPFYTKSLGFDSLFTNNTSFNHLNSSTVSIRIPAVDINAYNLVQVTTWTCLILSAFYILIKVFRK